MGNMAEIHVYDPDEETNFLKYFLYIAKYK
jgi:hypothetical protein